MTTLTYNSHVLYRNHGTYRGVPENVLKTASDTLTVTLTETALQAIVISPSVDTLSASVTEVSAVKTITAAVDTLQAQVFDLSVDVINNGGFEAVLLPSETEAYYGVPFVRSAAAARTGGFGVRLTTDSTINPQGFIHWASLGALVPANTNLVVEAWVRIPNGVTMTMSGRIRDQYGTYITEGLGVTNVTGNGGWQYVKTSYTYATTSFSPGMQIILASPASGLTIDLDDVSVRKIGFATVNVTAVDTLSVSVGDTSADFVPRSATDALSAAVNDVSAVQNEPSAIDTLSASVTEARVLKTVFTATDTLSAAVFDTVFFNRHRGPYQVFYWSGSAWVEGELLVWNGSAWIAPDFDRWTGSAWV